MLPGDPGRARWIAEQYFTHPRLYSDHRGLLGYTGRFRGVEISVQTSGMGGPSAAIVTEELIQLGAKQLLRVGTCGALQPSVGPADLVIAQAAVPLDGTSRQYLGGDPYAPAASYPLLERSVRAARAKGWPYQVGLIATEDAFYAENPQRRAALRQRGVLAVEMEAAALLTIAALRGVQAGCLLTCSNPVGEAFIAPEALQQGVAAMVEVALEALSSPAGEA